MKYPLLLLCVAALASTPALSQDETTSKDKQPGTFASLDKDSDGQLSQDELASTGLASSFTELDGNSDGFVSKREFRRNTRSKPASDR